MIDYSDLKQQALAGDQNAIDLLAMFCELAFDVSPELWLQLTSDVAEALNANPECYVL